MKLRVIILSFIFLSATALSAAEPTYTIDQWGINSQRAASLYLPTPANTKYDYQRDPQYNNQIMKHIMTINPAFAEKITILRSVEQPTRDLLMVGEKLCSIMEIRNNVNAMDFKVLFANLRTIYGTPQLSKEGDYTTYSFTTDKTQVLLVTRTRDQTYDLKIYFYASALFRMLMME